MKTLLVAIGITAGLMASLPAQVGSGPSEGRSESGPYQTGAGVSRDLSAKRKVVTHTPQQERCTYYFTNYTATGSFIPVVIRRYKGFSRPLGASRGYDAYTGADVSAASVLDIGTSLRRLEPDVLGGAAFGGHR